ncbi:MAG: sulfotransferase family protein [Planctomycetota bacterium]|jgi:hypothetical protein
MNDAPPIFVMTTARSGGTLLARMLEAHPSVAFASDPLLPMMKAIRDAAWIEARDAHGAADLVGRPFEDGFGTHESFERFRAIVDADLRRLHGCADWPGFLEASRGRAAHMCPDLVPMFDRLSPEAGWQEQVTHCLRSIRDVRGGDRTTRAGFKDVWTVALWPMLARAYPNARSILLVRDPRAILASVLALAERDPTQRAHCVSYVWHWKQLAAFALADAAALGVSGRQLVLRYEDLVSNPAATAARVCGFLDITPAACMLDAATFTDHAGSGVWTGNSSFTDRLESISTSSLCRWTDNGTVPPGYIAMTERLAGPEMAALGYATTDAPIDEEAWNAVFAAESAADCSWASGLTDARAAADWCLARDAWIDGDARPSLAAGPCFLHESVLERVRRFGAPAPVRL